MTQKMKEDKKKYFNDFEVNLRELHRHYRNLEHDHDELTSTTKLYYDVDLKLKEREALRLECEKVDKSHQFMLN
jgi:exonuclease VII small subunit